MASRIRHTKKPIAHGRFRYSDDEISKTKDATHEYAVFAYMRRSTNKKEQEDSLLQQDEGIQHISHELGIKLEDIRTFSETYSGFENKTRKQFHIMLEEILSTKKPVIILCRDISRLSRNPTDSQMIMDMLYGDNKYKKKPKISAIYTQEYGDIKKWDKNSSKDQLHKDLSASYYDSLDTRKKSIDGILNKLRYGEFPYHAPKGLEHFLIQGRRVLKQNQKMQFVRHAFEMKANRRGHKEISGYLSKQGSIKMGEKELTDRLFNNTVYIGNYTEKTTGIIFDNILFLEGKTPITLSLWNKVQNVLSKRGRIYRDAQERDVFEEKGRTERGLLLARDNKTKKTRKGQKSYTYYKNTKAKINIAQHKIIAQFRKEIEKIIYLWSKTYIEGMCIFVDKKCEEVVDFIKEWPPLAQTHMKLLIDPMVDKARTEMKQVVSFYSYKEYSERNGNFLRYFLDLLHSSNKNLSQDLLKPSHDNIKKIFSRLPIYTQRSQIDKIRMGERAKLDHQRKKIELERKEYRKKAVLAGFTRAEIEEATNDFDSALHAIDCQIEEISEDNNMGQFLERLPDILTEIVELSLGIVTEEEIEKKKEDLIKLFEIVVSNFSVSTKKELKIELFEVLERLVNGENVSMEAPAGVEPASRALQAPVGPFYQGAK